MLDYCLQDVRVLLSCVQVYMAETCTIAGKSILRLRYRQQSREGLLWLLQQEVTLFPGIQHTRSTHGEKSVCGAPVDGFHAASNTVLQYHGCFYHGCPKCYPDSGACHLCADREHVTPTEAFASMRRSAVIG
jgi:hypothetical protein